MNSEELSNVVAKGMEDLKAEDIVLMDLRKVKGAISDFFVICSGNSDTQIEAIAESIEKGVKAELNERPWRKEGFTNREWILIDYVNVVAHIFNKDKRGHYAIDELWGDAIISHVDQKA